MNHRVLFALACLAGAACTDHSDADAVGTLEVRVATTGTPDANGYTLSVEGQPDRAMASTDTTFYNNLPFGDYGVTLAGAEAGCTVAGGATVTKFVAVGYNRLEFDVTCP